MSGTHPCAGTGPGTVQYDACHAADQQIIAWLRQALAEIAAMRPRGEVAWMMWDVARAALRETEGHDV